MDVFISCKLEFHSPQRLERHHGRKGSSAILRFKLPLVWHFFLISQVGKQAMVRYVKVHCMLEESPLGVSAQYFFEGFPEVFIEDGVDDRVERGIAVANPEEKGEERGRDDTGLWAHSLK